MLLAQGRFWRATLREGSEALALALLREALPEELQELRDLKLEVPLARWNGVVKHVRTDRKLLGGILLDFTRDQAALAGVLGNDRLYGELPRIVLEASASLVEAGALVLRPAAPEA